MLCYTKGVKANGYHLKGLQPLQEDARPPAMEVEEEKDAPQEAEEEVPAIPREDVNSRLRAAATHTCPTMPVVGR